MIKSPKKIKLILLISKFLLKMLRWTLLLIFIVKIVFSEPNTTDAIKVIKLYSNASQDLEI